MYPGGKVIRREVYLTESFREGGRYGCLDTLNFTIRSNASVIQVDNAAKLHARTVAVHKLNIFHIAVPNYETFGRETWNSN